MRGGASVSECFYCAIPKIAAANEAATKSKEEDVVQSLTARLVKF